MSEFAVALRVALAAAAALLLVEGSAIWAEEAPVNRSWGTVAEPEALPSLGDSGCSVCMELAAVSLFWAVWRFGGARPRKSQLAGSASWRSKLGTGLISTKSNTRRSRAAMQSAFRSAVLAGDLSEAVLVFREMRCRVDDTDFGLLVDACATRLDVALLSRVFEDVVATGARPSQAMCHAVGMAYVKCWDIKEGRRMLNRMQELGHEPDRVLYVRLMSCSYNRGAYDEVFSLCDEMIASGLDLDDAVISVVMHASCVTPDQPAGRRALSILDARCEDICSSLRVLHVVLSTCLRWLDFKHLDLALREFQRHEHSMRATGYTYLLVLRANAALGRTDAAQLVWENMLRRNVQPTGVLVASMISALVAGKRVDEALDLFRTYQGTVCYDNVVYTAVIKGFADERDSARALAMFKDMKEAGVRPNSVTYATVITACTHDPTMAPAQAVFRELLASDLQPTVSVYTALIRGHCRAGGMKEALELLHQMCASGLAADAVVYNTLLDGCVNHKMWGFATVVLQEMDARGIRRTSFTACVLVKMWSRRKELEKAIEVAHEALASGVAYGRRALQLFAEMKTWPGFDGPDAHVYSALILGLANGGLLREAVEITEEACTTLRRNFTTSVISDLALRALLDALLSCCARKHIAGPLAEKLHEAGMPRFRRWLRHGFRDRAIHHRSCPPATALPPPVSLPGYGVPISF